MPRPRVGHSRPLGTTRRIRLYDHPDEPELGTLAFDAPADEKQRLYRIVGVEEVARPGRWNLILERLAYDVATLSDPNEKITLGLVPRP